MWSYKSPITRISEAIQDAENNWLSYQFKVRYDIDYDELLKALRYERDQYDKGYHDGYLAGLEARDNESTIQ